MAEENASLVNHMSSVEKFDIGRRLYYRGELWGKDVIVVFSHWGKVAAASTTAVLITRFGVKEVIFTGVAGAIDPSLAIGDIVVASDLYQHDMDARPLIKRYEIPMLGLAAMPSDLTRRKQLVHAANAFVDTRLRAALASETVEEFSLHSPRVVIGAVASGDQFIASQADVDELRCRLSDVACVEMEGGAVAQVCSEFGTPFSVVRTISDSANDTAGIDFPRFVRDVAQVYSLGIIEALFTDQHPAPPAPGVE